MTPINVHTACRLIACLQYQILREKTPKEIGPFQHQLNMKTASHEKIIEKLNENPDAWVEEHYLLYFREWTDAELKEKLETDNKLRLIRLRELHESMSESNERSQKNIREIKTWIRERGITIEGLVIPVEPCQMKY